MGETMNTIYKILLINPGSTSTKVAYYENEKCIFSRSVFHDSSKLLEFKTINDQLSYRMHVLRTFLKENHVDCNELDAVVGRGGGCYACASGTYEIDKKLVEDTRNVKGHLYHSSMLGVQMAYEIASRYDCKAYMIDPPVVDELCDEARITGLKNTYRRAIAHVLNVKEAGRVYAKEVGKSYEDLNLIIAHIDGGISITAHQKGRMIDGNDAGGGEGPFTPTRMGSMAITDVLNYLKDKSEKEIRDLCSQAGGLSSWFGTSDGAKIYYEMVRKGDANATRVWNAMLYQCAKWICMMTAPLEGNVDGIVLTGGLLRIPGVIDYIKQKCEWIAPITAYPGEFESEAMVNAALRMLRKQEEPLKYTGEPVWNGFEESYVS